MVSSYTCYNGMTIWTCLSTDETPVGKNGDILQIMDTDKQYRFDGENNEWIGLQKGDEETMKYLYIAEDDNSNLRAYKDTERTEFESIDEVYNFIGDSPFAFIDMEYGSFYYPLSLMPKDDPVFPFRTALIYLEGTGPVTVYLYGVTSA